MHEIEKILLESGWFKGRNVNISNDKKCLEEDKYELSLLVEHFLHEYSGLTIKFETSPNGKDYLHFNVCKSVKDIDSRWVNEDYINRIPTSQLCPIGQAYNNHLTLFMDELGNMYGGYDDNLYFIGNTAYDAIQILIRKEGAIEIFAK